jgi:subtilase family serine protease
MIGIASVLMLTGLGQLNRGPEPGFDITQMNRTEYEHMRPAGKKRWDFIHIPESSKEKPEDAGKRAHTHCRLRIVGGMDPKILVTETMTPQLLKQMYNLPASGGSGIIAIVDAYDLPTALSDFNTFSQKFGLPTESSSDATSSSNQVFQVVYAGGSKPDGNDGWNLEEALDIEYAHAVAPGAKIVLFEAKSNGFDDLFDAVKQASRYIKNNGGKGELSMSFGGSEWSGESQYDGSFREKNVVYFASSGDKGGTQNYPSASPYVVSVGGTMLSVNMVGHGFGNETGWSGSGGGPSQFEPMPGFQKDIAGQLNGKRGMPDVSFDASPQSGVLVYISQYKGESGWWIVGGTSVSSPCFAGVVNLSGRFEKSSQDELKLIYKNKGGNGFRDVTSGSAGSFSCGSGWDFVTGWGSPVGLDGK